ncbi:MAG: hypothetical protein AAGI11_03390 [Pseudomonadota bacterium]
MDNSDKPRNDNETILMALDQISQTIDVMTSVVGRLRHHLQEQQAAAEAKQQRDQPADIPSDRIIH